METDKGRVRFCEKPMRLQICAAHGYGEMILGCEIREGKIVWLILKYRRRIKCICVNKEELVKQCDEWQRGNKRVSNLTKVLKEEMESISPGFVWQNK
jgi:hypothetical protein